MTFPDYGQKIEDFMGEILGLFCEELRSAYSKKLNDLEDILLCQEKDNHWISISYDNDMFEWIATGWDGDYRGATLVLAVENFIKHLKVQREYDNYPNYLNSDDWSKKAEIAKGRAGWRCQLCNKSKDVTTLHTHHRTYERIYHELPDDLIVLCEDCHAKFHDIK